jgi:hypothetical protein
VKSDVQSNSIAVFLIETPFGYVSREQAISQACAFPSPFGVSMSATAILQQSRMDAALHLGKARRLFTPNRIKTSPHMP